MSIAEKLIKIAENEPKVFEAGKTGVIKGIKPAQINTDMFQDKLQTIANNTLRVYEAGQQLADDLKTTVSGSAIRVDDVNSIEHKLGVRVKSKNLAIDLKDREDIAIASGPTLEKPITGTKLFKGIAANGYASSGNIVAFRNENGVITYITSNTAYGIGIDVEVQGGKTYTISAKTVSVSSYVVWRVGFYKDGLSHSYVTMQTTFTVPEECNQVIVSIHPALDNEEISFSDFQLEPDSTATPYTPFISDFSGVEVSRYGKSLIDFPVTTLVNNKWDNNGTSFGREFVNVSHLRNKTITFQVFVDVTNIDENNSPNYTNCYGCAMLWFYNSDNTNAISSYSGNFIYYSQKSGISKITVKVPDIEGVTALLGSRISFYGYTTTEALGEDYIKISNPMVELGTATEYEPYKEPQTVTANAEGIVEGLTSLAPTMTLIPNSNEVIIEMEYFRDIDLALENQIIEIAMSGGE